MPTNGGVDASIYGMQPQEQPNLLQMLAGNDLAQTQADSARVGLAQAKLQMLHGELSALAAKRDLSQDDVQTMAGRLVRMGLLAPEDAQREVQTAQQYGGNTEALRSWLGNHVQSIAGTHDRFRSVYGDVTSDDLGDNLLTRSTNPATGRVNALSVAPKTLTPQNKVDRITTYQGGQPGSVPVGTTSDRYGNPIKPQMGGPQASAGAPAGGSMAPAGFIPSGPSLGQTAVAESGAQQYVRDLQSAAGSAGELANLQGALGSVQALGPEGTGPGTAGRNRVASFLNTVGLGKLPGVDPKRIENLDEAIGYLGSAAKSGTLNPAPGQAPGTGAPTTPSTDVSQPAAVNLLRAQIGLKRFQQAQARSYQGQDNGAGYGQHAAEFASQQDPRAYSFDLRTPEEKQKLLDGLGPKDGPAYRKFIGSLRTAHDLGLTNAGQ